MRHTRFPRRIVVVVALAFVIFAGAAFATLWFTDDHAARTAATTVAASTAGSPPGEPRGTPAPPRAAYTVCLQPLGEHDASLLAPVSRGIAQAWGFTVQTLEPRPLPQFAWYPPRSRYRADSLLAHLLYDVMPGAAGCHAVMGFTAVDVSTTKGGHIDWGVLGLAYHGGRVAVVSSFRLRRGVARPQLVARAVKVVIHELGHVAGVPHRDDGAACIMNDAVGAVATIDRAEGAPCAGERADAERFLGLRLPVRERLDWNVILGE